jgi:aerobic C4-dicarboxylate transport protein
VAITIGCIVGHYWPAQGEALRPLGDAFIKLVRMVIAPVIFLTVTTGIAGMRSIGALGRVAATAFGYFLLVSTLALILGLVVANIFAPGAGMHVDPASLDAGAVAQYQQQAHDESVAGFLMGIIPTTAFSALVDGQILQVLFVAVLFGCALTMVGDRAAPVVTTLETISVAFFQIVHIVMRTAPLGALGAIAFTIGRFGIESIVSLAALVATFYLTSVVFIVFVLGGIAWLGGFSIFRLISYLREEVVLVLGTSSSESALPSLIEKMENAGCSKSIVGVVVPTGYSFNLDGTNIYMTLAALFIAQALGIELSLGSQILLLLVAMLSSKGAAGVSGAGFIALAATLSVVPSVPVAGLALVLGVDRFMSECRAITNFLGNAVATVVIARWHGELDPQRFAAVLARRPVPLTRFE